MWYNNLKDFKIRGNMIQIIAEAGVNHNGILPTALRMVEAAKRAGADVVKFQVYNADLLTSDPAEKAMLGKYEFTPLEWERIVQHCQKTGIEFLATPFDLPSVDLLEKLSVKRYKVASLDIVNLPLLEKIASKDKPVLLSTGMATNIEIRLALDVLAGMDITLLHCVSEYPCPLAHANLWRIIRLAESFYPPVGFSDHTVELETGMLAVACGATALEKHFTLDRSYSGPDQAMSLEPGELRRYINMARLAEQAMGMGVETITEREMVLRSKTRRSLYATRDIAPSEIVTLDNSIALRPQVEGAYTPVALYIGQARATQGIRKGEAIR